MCGIAGVLGSDMGAVLPEVVRGMADTLSHRGPDDAGVWVSDDKEIVLAHRRLSVIELSCLGAQPMVSVGSRYTVTFNGEIYNHLELRKQLIDSVRPPVSWRGNSDTETMLACFEAWGIEEALKCFVGMFALSLWDNEEKKLYLARDRMGEKPLYYGWVSNAFVFGSELKALKAYPGFSNPVCRDALSRYLQHNYVPAPYSIYKNIYKLEPGCCLCVTPEVSEESLCLAPITGEHTKGLSLSKWWSLDEIVKRGEKSRMSGEGNVGQCQELERSLCDSIRMQSISDVPLGAFLSGGVDSSLVVALMQSQATSPVKTFTIGFSETEHNEAIYAKNVARHLGTEHAELYVSPEDCRGVIPKLPEMYDEPFADSSQIPTYLVAQLAKQQVTVALSGDGGDELFGGYNRYLWGQRLWSKISWLPFPARGVIGRFLQAQPVERIDKIVSFLLRLVTREDGVLIGEKVQKVAELLLCSQNMDDFYQSITTIWKAPLPVLGVKHHDLSEDVPLNVDFSSTEERMMYLDTIGYLPDDILSKVDRAAMGVSLETRIPFLDHRIVEMAWRLPLTMKIREGQGKWSLRQILYQYVPKELIERPKQGFSLPLGDWLRGPLREWADELLDPARLSQEGYLNSELVHEKWMLHCSGKYDYHAQLWGVLMFQSWLAAQ